MLSDLSPALDRRAFLTRIGAGVSAGIGTVAVAGCWRTPAAYATEDATTVPSHSVHPIGAELFTVRAAMQADVDRTLTRVAAIGYREVEMAGYFGRSARQIRDSLRSAGLVAPSALVSLGTTPDDWARVLEDAHTIGHRYVVIPTVPSALRQTLDGWRQVADRCNHAAEAAAKAGMQFAYHNHADEFIPIDGRVPYDLLVASTDPTLVALEIDLYWMTRAGQDPLTYFARWPGRIPLVHVKDSLGPPAHRMADVGAGTIDWRRLFAHRAEAGIRHFFVERDDAPDPFASLAASYAYLTRLDVPS